MNFSTGFNIQKKQKSQFKHACQRFLTLSTRHKHCIVTSPLGETGRAEQSSSLIEKNKKAIGERLFFLSLSHAIFGFYLD